MDIVNQLCKADVIIAVLRHAIFLPGGFCLLLYRHLKRTIKQ